MGVLMDMQAFNAALDLLEWHPLDTVEPEDSDLPYAVSSAVLYVGEFPLKVFHLSNGERVIDADDFTAFFELLTEPADV